MGHLHFNCILYCILPIPSRSNLLDEYSNNFTKHPVQRHGISCMSYKCTNKCRLICNHESQWNSDARVATVLNFNSDIIIWIYAELTKRGYENECHEYFDCAFHENGNCSIEMSSVNVFVCVCVVQWLTVKIRLYNMYVYIDSMINSYAAHAKCEYVPSTERIEWGGWRNGRACMCARCVYCTNKNTRSRHALIACTQRGNRRHKSRHQLYLSTVEIMPWNYFRRQAVCSPL